MIIDAHAHYLPQTMLETLSRKKTLFPSVNLISEGSRVSLQFGDMAPTRPIMTNLRNIQHRFDWMAEQAIDKQIVAGWLDAFGYTLPTDEGCDWSRFSNEEMLKACSLSSKLIPLATLPMQDGLSAARVLKESIHAGFKGAMIGTQPKGNCGTLDDPGLDPFWQTAAETDSVIFIHPMFGSDDKRLDDYGMMNAVGRVTDTTVAVSRLLFSGHLLKYPGLKLIVATAGGALPFMLGRLMRNHEAHPGQWQDPLESFKRLYFDSIVFEPRALRFLSDIVGSDRILLGSDYPFPIGDPFPKLVVKNANYDSFTAGAILGGTAEKLFKL